MKLNNALLDNKEYLINKGYNIPSFDRFELCRRTKEKPVWLHFGSGNIFRAFPAALCRHLLDSGLIDTGIIAAEGYDYEIIDKVYKPYDDLSVLVTLIPDGSAEKTITGSVTESVKTDDGGMLRLRDIFAAGTLQIVSFTITEKGYDITRSDGSLQQAIADDINAGPADCKSFLGKLTSLCLYRYQNCKAPLALVSMDNCSHNGLLLHKAIETIAQGWIKNNHIDSGFVNYINDPSCLSFPCTMIDKITPYPDKAVAEMLSKDGIEGMEITETKLHSVTAPFVNAEKPEYLVVEDIFPNGRPPLEHAGVIFTTREIVDKVEKMKVCTCLNPLHTAVSVFAMLLGITRVSDAMRDKDLLALTRAVADEGLPVVTDPGVISPQEFINTVINERLPNPYIPDTPFRIVTDTSKKLSVRFGETIKAYIKSGSLDAADLSAIPLVLAGWCRLLTGIDDKGNAIELPPDPQLPQLQPLPGNITSGTDANAAEMLRPILSDSKIFGIDLYKAGIAEAVIEYFNKMISAPGAVRDLLRNYNKG